MSIFDGRKSITNSKIETLFEILKIDPTFSILSTNDIALHRAECYVIRKTDWLCRPIRSTRFLGARRTHDKISKNGAQESVQTASNSELVSKYALLVYGENLCVGELRKLIRIETQAHLTRASIRKTLKDINVVVDGSGIVHIRPQNCFLTLLGFGILGASIPFSLFALISLIYMLLFMNCAPLCAIAGGIELLLFSGIFASLGSRFALINKDAQFVLARDLHI